MKVLGLAAALVAVLLLLDARRADASASSKYEQCKVGGEAANTHC